MTAEPKVETIEARIAGRYLVQAPTGAAQVPVLVGFHGYGENAEQHLRELRRIPGSDGWLLVSVQALNRFYDRKTQTVVGSWMTSQDREQMIDDNVAYVDSVVATILREHATTSTLVYVGFSQGVAMAYRAAIRGRHPASGIIVLAGDVPPELRTDVSGRWPPVLLARGINDPYYTQDTMNEDVGLLEKNGVPVESVIFDGTHAWHDDVRAAAGRLLDLVRR